MISMNCHGLFCTEILGIGTKNGEQSIKRPVVNNLSSSKNSHKKWRDIESEITTLIESLETGVVTQFESQIGSKKVEKILEYFSITKDLPFLRKVVLRNTNMGIDIYIYLSVEQLKKIPGVSKSAIDRVLSENSKFLHSKTQKNKRVYRIGEIVRYLDDPNSIRAFYNHLAPLHIKTYIKILKLIEKGQKIGSIIEKMFGKNSLESRSGVIEKYFDEMTRDFFEINFFEPNKYLDVHTANGMLKKLYLEVESFSRWIVFNSSNFHLILQNQGGAQKILLLWNQYVEKQFLPNKALKDTLVSPGFLEQTMVTDIGGRKYIRSKDGKYWIAEIPLKFNLLRLISRIGTRNIIPRWTGKLKDTTRFIKEMKLVFKGKHLKVEVEKLEVGEMDLVPLQPLDHNPLPNMSKKVVWNDLGHYRLIDYSLSEQNKMVALHIAAEAYLYHKTIDIRVDPNESNSIFQDGGMRPDAPTVSVNSGNSYGIHFVTNVNSNFDPTSGIYFNSPKNVLLRVKSDSSFFPFDSTNLYHTQAVSYAPISIDRIQVSFDLGFTWFKMDSKVYKTAYEAFQKKLLPHIEYYGIEKLLQ